MQASGLTEFIAFTCTSAMGDGGLGGVGEAAFPYSLCIPPAPQQSKVGLGSNIQWIAVGDSYLETRNR